MSDTEEFQIFKRIEDLEKTTKALKATKATARENRALLLMTFWLAFAAAFGPVPHLARASKDDIIHTLKGLGLRQQVLDALNEIMLKQCEIFETAKRR